MRSLTTALIVLALAAATKLAQQGGSPPTEGSQATMSKDDKAGPKKADKSRTFPSAALRLVQRTFIATVPDPKLTRLGLHFDRFVNVLQRAAENRGYLFESQWLPWSVEADEYREPGVLFFRRDNEHMAILLVGESPSFGVSENQFRQAMAYACHNPSGLIGPIFSGSFHSLKELLAERKDISVYGGSPTSDDAIDDFTRNHFVYHNYTVTSHAAAEELRWYWNSRKIDFHQIIELNEGGTAYGASSAFSEPGTPRPIVIPFPRDLSVLRRAYETDQKLTKSLAQQGFEPASVQLSKTDEPAGGDWVPVQMPSQTAATQELELQTAARTIRDGRYGLGSIQATNVLDTLFLRQYMAAHAPDMQFVLLEPDVLFLHAPEVAAFHGSIAISHYPMFSAPKSRPEFFPSNASAGIYLAARALIPPEKPDEKPAVDFPCDLWITIVGLDGYWPVAHLHSDGTDVPAFYIRVPMMYGSVYLLFLICLATVVFGTIAARLHRIHSTASRRKMKRAERASKRLAPRRWCADYIFDPKAPLSYARRYHVFSVVTALAVIVAVLSFPLQEKWGWLIHLPTLLLAVAGIVVAHPFARIRGRSADCEWFDHKRATRDRRLTHRIGAVVAVCAATVLAAIFVGLWAQPEADSRAHFAAYRSLFFGNGVNPTLPILFAILSSAACAWYHFHRFVFASERFVPLRLKHDGDLGGPYERTRNILSQYGTLPALALGGIAIALVVALALNYGSAFTIEGKVYDWTFIVALAMCSGLTMLSVCQFVQAWWHLSDFLKGLEGLPLRSVFHDLPRDLGSVALFRSSIRERTYLYATRGRDLLHKVGGEFQYEAKAVDAAVGRLLERAGADERETAEEARTAQTALADAQGVILDVLEQRYWNKGQSTLAPDKNQTETRVIAEEFVALRFVSFIRYATVQLRNLLSFFSVSFILQAMAVSSYPFFSHSLSRMYILCAFGILASTVSYVLWGMSRDPVLRSLAADEKGTDSPVLRQAIQSASLPLLAFASTYFPELGRTLFSWAIPIFNSTK